MKNVYDEYTIIFTPYVHIGIDVTTILSVPDYVIWANGEMPTLEYDVWYELSISRSNIYSDSSSSVYRAVITPFKSV